jgi:hypothetical protein
VVFLEAIMPILNAAPPWKSPRSRYITLWHGCTTEDKHAIMNKGVDVIVGTVDVDFGRGFYTTTFERQARHWAWLRFYDPKFARKTGVQPVVLRFRVDRHKLANLSGLAFVVADYSNEDYWSLVQHCRQSIPTAINDHKGPVHDGHNHWYDVVYGPVSAFWGQRVAMADSDQLSFHTQGAAQLLTDLVTSSNKTDFDWMPVV